MSHYAWAACTVYIFLYLLYFSPRVVTQVWSIARETKAWWKKSLLGVYVAVCCALWAYVALAVSMFAGAALHLWYPTTAWPPDEALPMLSGMATQSWGDIAGIICGAIIYAAVFAEISLPRFERRLAKEKSIREYLDGVKNAETK